MDKTIDKVIKEAAEHVTALVAERIGRGGKHADDQRVATEIAAHQFDLGFWLNACKEHNQAMRKRITENDNSIREIQSIIADLQTEMNIAIHIQSPAND